MNTLKQFLQHNAFLFIIGVVLIIIATRTLPYRASENDEPAANTNSATPSSVVEQEGSTAPLAGNQAVLIAAGDIADCYNNNDDATAKLVESIQGTVATLGDNVYPIGTEENYTRCYQPTWGRFKGRTKPAVGNHDYNSSAQASAYFNYFASVLGDTDDAYYSYDLGAWHIIVLDSNCTKSGCKKGTVQYDWLKNDLQGNSNQCTLAVMHHARFSSGRVHGSSASVEPLWQALYDGGADVVLSGHEHNYERFAPQDPQGRSDSAQGIREFVVGTGGESLYAFARTVTNSEVRSSASYGVLKLTLSPASYKWQFIPVAGSTFTDSGDGVCH